MSLYCIKRSILEEGLTSFLSNKMLIIINYIVLQVVSIYIIYMLMSLGLSEEDIIITNIIYIIIIMFLLKSY